MNPAQIRTIPGAHLDAFCALIKKAEALVDHLEGVEFHSLYTALPLVTQLLGLENPLFGSGKSPYSVISILPKIKDRSVVKWELELSLGGRRQLIDEIYEMIAPILLDEEEAYMDLMVEVVHEDEFRDDPAMKDDFRQLLQRKLAALAPLARRLRLDVPGNFAHIAHYDGKGDLRSEHGHLKHLSEEQFEKWTRSSFPTVVEVNFRGFRAPVPVTRGWVLLVNNSTEQLMNSNKLRKSKILQCAKLAERLGARIVGMAGLIAFFGKGGVYLSESFPGLGFTTGHAYTIANIREIALTAAERVGLRLPEATVAIVGAAGSIGSGCATLFAQLGVPHLILIDILSQEALEAVAQRLSSVNSSLRVTCSNRLRDMREADLSVVATNSPRTIIESEFLKPGSIVIDDSFPKNVPESMPKLRRDVIALEGGAIRLPLNLDVDLARNLPNILNVPFTRMVSCQEIYGCFAETLILAAHGHSGNYGVGASNPALAEDILAKGRQLGMRLAPLQFSGQAISDSRFIHIAQTRGGSEI